MDSTVPGRVVRRMRSLSLISSKAIANTPDSTALQIGDFPHGGTPLSICATQTKLRITQQGVRLVSAFQPDPTSRTWVVLLERELDPYFRRGTDLLRMQVLLQPIEGVDLEPHESRGPSIPPATSLCAHVCATTPMAD